MRAILSHLSLSDFELQWVLTLCIIFPIHNLPYRQFDVFCRLFISLIRLVVAGMRWIHGSSHCSVSSMWPSPPWSLSSTSIPPSSLDTSNPSSQVSEWGRPVVVKCRYTGSFSPNTRQPDYNSVIPLDDVSNVLSGNYSVMIVASRDNILLFPFLATLRARGSCYYSCSILTVCTWTISSTRNSSSV